MTLPELAAQLRGVADEVAEGLELVREGQDDSEDDVRRRVAVLAATVHNAGLALMRLERGLPSPSKVKTSCG